MIPTKPYFIRALFQWIVDNNLTPLILVDNSNNVLELDGSLNDSEIFNISANSVADLQMTNTHVYFDARINGLMKSIEFPVSRVKAIYSRENNRGMIFPDDSTNDQEQEADYPERKLKKPQLKVIK